MPINVNVDDRGGQRRLRDVRGRFATLTQGTASRIVALIRDAARQQFETRGEYGGQRWPDLAPSTLAEKQRLGYGGMGILRRTDRMFDAFTKETSPDQETVITKTEIKFLVHDPKAYVHQQGRGVVPVRQIIPDPMPESFTRALRKIVSGYVVNVGFQ